MCPYLSYIRKSNIHRIGATTAFKIPYHVCLSIKMVIPDFKLRVIKLRVIVQEFKGPTFNFGSSSAIGSLISIVISNRQTPPYSSISLNNRINTPNVIVTVLSRWKYLRSDLPAHKIIWVFSLSALCGLYLPLLELVHKVQIGEWIKIY